MQTAAPSIPDSSVYQEQVRAAAAAVQDALGDVPTTALILGTGLGSLADALASPKAIAYEDIPHFPTSTVASHAGRLLTGTLGETPIVAMQGRFHLYEGYSAHAVTFPIRVLATLGVDTLIISNAAGGMNPHHRRGDLMLITDHINFQGANPLVGPNVDAWGPRFPDMSEPYDPGLRALAEEKALDLGIKLHQGVYLAVVGPNLETRAEYRFLRQLGADAVGMSTVPETIVANHMGVRILAFSVITDECFPDALEPVSIEEVLAAAAEAEPKLTDLLHAILADL